MGQRTIAKQHFAQTGHASTRVIFGAAALAHMRQDRADRVLETLLAYGVNHIDTAAAYGDSELRIAPWLRTRRNHFFVATKTAERTSDGARRSLEQSLERLGTDRVDLIQLHNLVDEDGWQTAHGPRGAVEALAAAREEGLVRFIGVTGHGTRVCAMHLRSLARFPFDSVLVPFNFTMMSQPDYAADFEALDTLCRERGVAVQTIKALAQRRWRDDDEERRFSWYKPIRDPAALRRAVNFVLHRPGVFLNTSSDATLLSSTLEAACETANPPREEAMREDTAALGVTALFVRDVAEGVSL